MSKYAISFKAKMWVYAGNAAWRFVTVPKTHSVHIRKLFSEVARGFGSIRVEARIGNSVWKTSIFPDTKAGAYVLPIKASVRKAEGVVDGKFVAVTLSIIES